MECDWHEWCHVVSVRVMPDFQFHLLQASELNLALNWLKKPHVTKWFHGEGLQNTIAGLQRIVDGQDHHFDAWVATLDDHSFALVMSYKLTEKDRQAPNCPQGKWMAPGKTYAGLDLFIGEESFLGKGLASSLISTFIQRNFPYTDSIFIDPEKENKLAIHVYEKVGFKVIDEFIAPWNPVPHVLMQFKSSI